MDTKLISTGIRYSGLPESYLRPESDRPKLSEIEDCADVPIIDFPTASVIRQIGDACRLYGFFQVTNHGVSTEAVERMMEVANEFFRLPVEEKMKLYSDDPSKTIRLSTSFNVKKETVHNWRDYLRLHCHPLDQYVPEWPSNPASFKFEAGPEPDLEMAAATHMYESLSLFLEEAENVKKEMGSVLKEAKSIRAQLEDMDRENAESRRVSGCREGTPVDRTRSAVANGLRKELMMEFQGLRQRMMTEDKETVGRRYFTVTGDDPDRHDAAKEIEKSLLELYQVSLDMAVMVEAQGEQLDDIHHHVINVAHCVSDGTKNLKTAIQSLLLILILILVVVIPIATSFSKS